MYPELFHVFNFPLYSYGLFIAIAFITGISLAKSEAVKVGEDPEKIYELAFYVIVAAIVGSRLFYIATKPDYYLANPIEIFKLAQGGLVFYGGFIGAAAVVIIYLKIHKLNLWKVADIAAPSLAIGHCLGRIGCFMAGCCFGRECDLPWAIAFHNEKSLAPLGVDLHPTQLYSSLGNFVIFLLILALRRKKKFEGQVFWMYVLVYGLFRSFVETFRGDFRGDLGFGTLSFSQSIGLTMSLSAVVMLIILSRRSRAAGENV